MILERDETVTRVRRALADHDSHPALATTPMVTLRVTDVNTLLARALPEGLVRFTVPVPRIGGNHGGYVLIDAPDDETCRVLAVAAFGIGNWGTPVYGIQAAHVHDRQPCIGHIACTIPIDTSVGGSDD